MRRALIANGDAVHVLVRRAPRHGVETEWHPERSELDPSVLRDVDAVVCLSGVSLGRRRWSDQVKRDIVASRVQPVATLARALAENPDRPSVYITASGAGSYGDTGSRVIDESAPYSVTQPVVEAQPGPIWAVFDDAAKQALSQAQGTLRNIRAVDIVSTGIRGENLDEYRAHVRVAFLIEGTEVD